MIVKNPVSVPVAIERYPTPSWKRVLDLAGVVMAVQLLWPLFFLIALYIRLVSRGPVLFVQSRVGHGGDDFRIYKFRTMHVPEKSRDEGHRAYVASLACSNCPTEKPSIDGELIPGGALLRKFSIDEFPQLINVWRGDMSLVGPRPDLLRLEDYADGQERRFQVLPGMTGLWQVSGKNRLTFEEMIDLDLEYVETRSLHNDLRIILKTFGVVLFDDNE